MVDTQAPLGKKAAFGTAVFTIAQVVGQSIMTVRIIALAAVLPLHELGLFGVAAVVIQLTEQLSETGMRQALIQRSGEISDYVSPAWISQMSRGVFLGAIVYFAAGPAEQFFDKVGVQPLLQTLALLPVIQGITNLGIVHLHRELRFEKVVLLKLSFSVVDLVVSFILAIVMKSAMALVIARLIAAVVSVAMSFLLERRWPKVHFSIARFKALSKFGFWIFATSVLSFILISGGDLVVAKMLPASDLAIYRIASGIACFPLMRAIHAVSSTTYSTFSRIQNDKDRLSNAFLRVLALASFVAWFAIAGYFCLSVPFVDLFFKADLKPVAYLLTPLAVWGGCRALGAINSVLFQSIGKPAYATIFQFVMVILFAIAVVPAIARFGLMGLACSLATVGVIAQLGRYTLTVSTLGCSASDIAQRLLLPMIISALAIVVTAYSLSYLPSDASTLHMVLGVLLLSTTYGFCAWFIDTRFQFGISKFAKSLVPQRFVRQESLSGGP